MLSHKIRRIEKAGWKNHLDTRLSWRRIIMVASLILLIHGCDSSTTLPSQVKVVGEVKLDGEVVSNAKIVF